MWLDAREALKRLGSKPQSLYANVSRGRIRAKADPADSRRSLYREEDVDRVAKRSRGRRGAAASASEAMSWGEPVMATAISTVIGGRLYYRGRDAAELAETATLEEVAGLLWGGRSEAVAGQGVTEPPSVATAFAVLARRAAGDPPSAGGGPIALRIDAAGVHADVAAALAGAGDGLLHERLAERFGRPEAVDAIRRAMVLLADHELNASTFAARVTASTGGPLAAAALSGLATLHGPRHGDASLEVMALAEEIDEHPDESAEAALLDWLGERRVVPGFGHRLYPRGDVRCKVLLASMVLPPAFERLLQAGAKVLDEAPNIDFGLAALTAAYGLPKDAPAVIFALARSVGWLAHAIEQASSGTLIRPRARYIGPKPVPFDADAAQPKG